jgi:HK97 family phage major capsid protein
MAITKTEAAKLSSDLLLRGVIETVVKESSVLAHLPFMQVVGNSIAYNREANLPTAAFYQPGDTWVEATPTFTRHSAQLTILGGDADVDNFLQNTYANTNDIQAEVVANRAKAVAHGFSDSFFNGDSATNAKSFDGLHKLIPGGQTINAGTNGAALTLTMLDELIDRVKPGKPDMLFMTKRTRRKLKDLRRNSGTVLETTINQFGQQIEFYDGIPLLVDDFIKDDRSMGTGNNLSSVYAVRFGQGTGVMGLEHGEISVEHVGELETKDAIRTRIKWYCGLALFSELGAAKLEGVM